MSRREAYRRSLSAAKKRRVLQIGLGGLAVLAACATIRWGWPLDSAAANPDEPASRPAAATARSPDVMAVVNNQKISKAELAAECLSHYGTEVLESLVNRQLIAGHCAERGINVSNEEINAEVERLATRFGVPVDRWLTMLQQERNINPEQYRRDIIWPTIALRKLAANRLKVTDAEIADMYEAEFGEQIKVRMIGVRGDAKKAADAHREAKAKPSEFGRIAREYSDDTRSAAANGWIQPIRRNAGEKAIEEAAFSLKEGEVSNVIQIGEQYVILLCEGSIPARPVKMDDVRERLVEAIKEKKLRNEATELFQQLQKTAKVVNILNDEKKKAAMPGVAATINGEPIGIDQLSNECLARHGKEALDGLINRRLIEQALKLNNIRLTEKDIQDEIDDAARRMVGIDKDTGKPKVEEWIKQVTSEPGVTLELYVRDAVWPSVAMRALCKNEVKVTDQDLEKAFESNYGQKVRCAAIVLDDQRKAEQIWDLARKNPSREYFGELSAKHSTDASVSALAGEIPPIRMHGGRPQLEKEAFALQPGKMSGIIQTDGKFVILMCEGRTKTQTVKLEEVRGELYDHVWRIKINAAMGGMFDQLQQTASITNHLDPSKSREPAKAKTPAARTATRAGAAERTVR